MRLSSKSAFLLVSTLGLLACGASSDAEGDATRSSIINGSPSPKSQDAVLQIGHGDYRCTGTLIAPNLVLTARHCVSAWSKGWVGCKSDGTLLSAGGASVTNYPPGDIAVWAGSSISFGRPPATATGRAVIDDGSSNLCGHDIAFLVLDHAIDNLPIAPLRLKPSTTEGETLTIVGFGTDENGWSPMERQQRNVRVQKVGPYDLHIGGEGITAAELLVGEGACDGDSGGPSFSSDGAVVSIESRAARNGSGPSGCEKTETIQTHVSQVPDLVTKAFLAAGYTAPLEGEELVPIESAGCGMTRAAPSRPFHMIWGVGLLIASLTGRKRRALNRPSLTTVHRDARAGYPASTR